MAEKPRLSVTSTVALWDLETSPIVQAGHEIGEIDRVDIESLLHRLVGSDAVGVGLGGHFR